MTGRDQLDSPGELDEPHLSEVLDGLWRLLEEGVRNRDHGFHLPAVASLGRDGWPAVRTVVLRGVERSSRSLRFHSDRRSPKLAELAAEPRVSLLFYDPAELTQLRVSAQASIHGSDAVADAAWQATGLFSRRCYLQEPGPSQPVAGPTSALPRGLAARAPEVLESEAGRANFTVVLCRIEAIDWFYLNASGHRRARFAWDADGRLEAGWLAP